MAEDDIGARGFCRYNMVISRLMHVLGWDKKVAHREFCWAVKVGDLRIKGKSEERPDFPPDYYDDQMVFPMPGGEDIYGRPYGVPPLPPPPPQFMGEEYSIDDLERLIARLVGSGTQTTSIQQPRRTLTKGRDFREADRQLIEEMRHAITTGLASGPWAAADLVADQAEGTSDRENRKKRLVKRYGETFL
jgi:hypothetical protein